MSRESTQICRHCGVYRPDHGVGFTLIEEATVADFDETLFRRFQMKPEDLPADNTNRRHREFLKRHEGHGEEGVTYWSNDWMYDEDDPVAGLTLEGIDDRY